MNLVRSAGQLFAALWNHFGWWAPVLIFLIVIASFLEGLAITLLLPLLSVLGIIQAGDDKMQIFETVFSQVGISLDITGVVSLICGMVVLQYSTLLLQNWVSSTFQSSYLRSLRQQTFKRLISARWSYLIKHSVGELINFSASETARAASAVYVVVQLTSAITTTLIFVTIAVMLSWQLTAMLLGAAAVVAAMLYPIMTWSRRSGVATSVQLANSMSWLNEVFNGIKLIKATAAEDHVALRHRDIEGNIEKIQRDTLFQPHLLRVVFEASGILLLLVTLVLAKEYMGLDGAIVLTIVALFMRLYPRLGNIQHLIQQLFLTLPAVENLNELNRKLVEVEETVEMDAAPVEAGAIEVKDLSLKYGDNEVLKGIGLSLASGGHYALVGSSGAGKTSLVDCLLGLTMPDAGEILINDMSIDQLGLSNWRHSVGYVTQETVLFNMTVRDNIAWSNRLASDEDIELAARKANAHKFISELPNGYNTIVGDRGVFLSGGQRQRVGLARALLGDRALLILDEATSALDTESENIILDAIGALHGQLTVISIAHRLSTVRNCDKIFLMEGGNMIESGAWSELTVGQTRFSQLLSAQSLPTVQPNTP